jgi:hypothetical protein
MVRDSLGNEPFAMDSDLDTIAAEAVKFGRVDDSHHVKAIAKSLHEVGAIGWKRSVQEALNEAFIDTDYLQNRAAEKLVVEEAQRKGLPVYDAGILTSIVQALGEKGVLGLSARGEEVLREQRNAQHRSEQRRAWISTISEGGRFSNYPLWSTVHGQFKYIPCDTLEREADDMLHALATRVPGWRAEIAGKRVEREKEEEPEGISATVRGQTPPAAPQADNDMRLVNPDTGKEFTRRELINAPRDVMNRLMYFGDGRPNQKAIAAITRILSTKKFGE